MNVRFTIGRFNPPTIGHERLISNILNSSEDFKIVFIVDGEKSGQDFVRNPISSEFRKKVIEETYGIRCDIVTSAYQVFEVLDVLGVNSGTLVCGDDRTKSYQAIMKSYGSKFDIISIDRGTEISATQARSYAPDKEKFLKFMSERMNLKLVEDMRQIILKSKKVRNE